MVWATGLGFAFLTGQIAAWVQVLKSGAVLARNPHSWFIFLFTGLHSMHIFLGLGGLVYLLTRTHETATGPKVSNENPRGYMNGISFFGIIWILRVARIVRLTSALAALRQSAALHFVAAPHFLTSETN